MDELKIIADLISQLGGEARFAFVAWLIAKYGLLFVWGVVAIICCSWVISVILKLNQRQTKAEIIATEALRASGINKSPYGSGTYGSYEIHFNELLRWIESLKK